MSDNLLNPEALALMSNEEVRQHFISQIEGIRRNPFGERKVEHPDTCYILETPIATSDDDLRPRVAWMGRHNETLIQFMLCDFLENLPRR